MFKPPRFPTILFVVASLAAFILLGLLYALVNIKAPVAILSREKPSPERYYLNKNYYHTDPLITKRPTLGDILTGPIITSRDPSIGEINAPITVVLFSDYACSFCQQQENEIKKILEDYKGKIRLIWKDYPENNPFSISWQSAVAARCAGKQNKYWLYHDLLFSYNGNLSQESFLKLAQDINLNIKTFKQCLSNDRVANLVKDNILEANALDINGVPFIYVNDQEVLGQATFNELKRIIEIELHR